MQEISRIRGVTQVCACPIKGNGDWPYALEIDFSLRFEYRGELYDGGDWTMTLNSSMDPKLLSFQERRSGLLPASQRLTRPYYFDDHYNFCFGDREEKIEEYIRSGQIVAAVDLIMNSLHAISEKDQPFIPGCYKRVVQRNGSQLHTYN